MMDCLDLLVTLDQGVILAKMVQQALQVCRDPLDLLGIEDLLVLLALEDFKVCLVLQESLVSLVRMDNLVFRDSLG